MRPFLCNHTHNTLQNGVDNLGCVARPRLPELAGRAIFFIELRGFSFGPGCVHERAGAFYFPGHGSCRLPASEGVEVTRMTAVG
jgi:hypothetical protein